MSVVIACPLCGNTIVGPTRPPDAEVRTCAGELRCRRCDSEFEIVLRVTRLGALVGKIAPMPTSKP